MNAYVNHGRWVADCAAGCGNAHLVEPGDVFDCEICGTSDAVTFPDDMASIGEVLASRILPQTRNWLPGETVQHLVSENDAHQAVT